MAVAEAWAVAVAAAWEWAAAKAWAWAVVKQAFPVWHLNRKYLERMTQTPSKRKRVFSKNNFRISSIGSIRFKGTTAIE